MTTSFRFLLCWSLAGLAACDPAAEAPAPPPPILSQAPAEAIPPQVGRASKAPKQPQAEQAKPSAPAAVPALDARLVRITDGDTIVVQLNGKQERIRLIGINTPETKHSPRGPQPFAEEATNALRTLLGQHPLKLRFDAEERDRYGRLLAYVFVGDVFVNESMIRQGWARPLRVPPNVRHAKAFDRLAREAKRNRIGIWAAQ